MGDFLCARWSCGLGGSLGIRILSWWSSVWGLLDCYRVCPFSRGRSLTVPSVGDCLIVSNNRVLVTNIHIQPVESFKNLQMGMLNCWPVFSRLSLEELFLLVCG